MYCNIIVRGRNIIKKQCYKTKYKNIVIVKLEYRCYSITHYQTGVAISAKRYMSKNEALLSLDETVSRAREILKRNNITFKQFCKQNKIKQINF